MRGLPDPASSRPAVSAGASLCGAARSITMAREVHACPLLPSSAVGADEVIHLGCAPSAGIYIRDLLEAVPVDKYFELFQPSTWREQWLACCHRRGEQYSMQARPTCPGSKVTTRKLPAPVDMICACTDGHGVDLAHPSLPLTPPQSWARMAASSASLSTTSSPTKSGMAHPPWRQSREWRIGWLRGGA